MAATTSKKTPKNATSNGVTPPPAPSVSVPQEVVPAVTVSEQKPARFLPVSKSFKIWMGVAVFALMVVLASYMPGRIGPAALLEDDLSDAISMTLDSGRGLSAHSYAPASGIYVTLPLEDSRAQESLVTSPDGMRKAYVLAESDTSPAEIKIVDTQNGERATLVSVVSETARGLRWSPDGQSLIFTARATPETSPTDVEPDDWVVYRVSAQGGDAQFVATGTTPFFSPDGGSVYALRRDGLYRTQLDGSTTYRVWGIENEALAHRFMHVTPSPDGTKLAWSNPYSNNGEGKIFLFTITSWEPLMLDPTPAIVKVPALQVVFSPDNTTLAYLAGKKEDRSLALYALSLSDSISTKLLDLSGYSGARTLLSEWR